MQDMKASAEKLRAEADYAEQIANLHRWWQDLDAVCYVAVVANEVA
jgi:hypothetical protein